MITLRKTKRLRPASKNRVNFDHHHLHKNQVNRSSHSKQVNFGAHMINFEPPHKKQVTVDCNTKTKSNSISPAKIKLSSTPLLQSSQFDPQSKIKSISMPWHKDQVNFDPHPRAKYFSIPTQKSSQFRSLHWSQVNFDPTIKWSQFWCRDTKTKLISIPPTKTNSISTHTLNFYPNTKTKSFSTPHKNQVNSDPRTKNNSISIPILKPS